MSLALLLALALAKGAGPNAQPAPACDSNAVQMQLNACAAEEYRRADAELNAQWAITADDMRLRDRETAAFRSDGRPGYFDQLLAAQRAWLAYRDAHCASEGYQARGGSMESMLVSFCMASLTRTRTAQLQDLITP